MRSPPAAVRSKLVELLGLEEIPASVDYTTESRQEEDGPLYYRG